MEGAPSNCSSKARASFASPRRHAAINPEMVSHASSTSLSDALGVNSRRTRCGARIASSLAVSPAMLGTAPS
eukprot:1991770-Prymnesium_polylepis.1